MSANTWNVRAADMPDLIFNVEQMENAGKKVYGLVVTESIPFTFDGKEKRLAGETFSNGSNPTTDYRLRTPSVRLSVAGTVTVESGYTPRLVSLCRMTFTCGGLAKR